MILIMRFLRDVLLVFCCYFGVLSASRLHKCSDIVTTETENNLVSVKFTLKIPVLNNTDIVLTRVRISGPQETILHTSLSKNGDPKEGTTIMEDQTEVQYLLTYNASLPDPFIAGIEVGTADHCILYCEGSPDIRPNVLHDHVEHTFRLVGSPFASIPNCIMYEPMLSPLPEDCGITLIGRIFGGMEVERGSWPWLAPLYIRTRRGIQFQCAANIISSRTLVTAAHCLMNKERLPYKAQDIVVFTGRHHLYNYNERGWVAHNAQEVVIHPNYDRTYLHDIALINLDKDIEFTNVTQPVCLWSDPTPVAGNIASVAGWGNTKEGTVSQVPLFAEPIIVDINICKDSNEAYGELDLNSTICAGDEEETGPCKGDSGGGLILVDKNQRFSIRGVVSMTLGDVHTGECDLSNYVLYTDIAKYYNWIRSKMW